MFDYLKGVLIQLSLERAVLEVGGIGYKLLIPFSDYAKFPPVGKEVLVYLSAVIREDSHKLFGFLNQAERDLFETLGEVSGIGPKTALSLVGYMEGERLRLAIAQADVSLLSKIPGIGKKTAERLIVEMRDRIKKKQEKTPLPLENALVAGDEQLLYDAQNALINLGYNALQAQKAIKKAVERCGKTPSISELLSAALQASS